MSYNRNSIKKFFSSTVFAKNCFQSSFRSVVVANKLYSNLDKKMVKNKGWGGIFLEIPIRKVLLSFFFLKQYEIFEAFGRTTSFNTQHAHKKIAPTPITKSSYLYNYHYTKEYFVQNLHNNIFLDNSNLNDNCIVLLMEHLDLEDILKIKFVRLKIKKNYNDSVGDIHHAYLPTTIYVQNLSFLINQILTFH